MATLEDKILGEKLENYCSSSESSEDEGDSDNPIPNGKSRGSKSSNQPSIDTWDGSSVNTGPKGVLRDWQRFKQLETERRKESDAEKLNLMTKLSLTCQPDSEKGKSVEEEEEDDELEKEFGELLSDDFLKEYLEKRMEEVYRKIQTLPTFGRVLSLSDGDQFLDAVDREHKDVTVIIHLYENDISSCEAMNGCMGCLAHDYPNIKFCKIRATSAGLSKHFKVNGIPALLIYKGGQLMGNFVRMGGEFGEDFYASDVETFLIDHGLLPDKNLVPSLIRESVRENEDENSDFDVE